MGISGLLPLLKSIQKPCKLNKFAGQTIGVDAYGWLHRGTVACAIDLALGKPTRKYVDFSMHRVRMLIHFGLTPYLVFDGDYLPSKASTEVDRSQRRAQSKKKGLELYQMNKPSQAHLELQKAIEVTPAMARELIEELKRANVQYIVAPYEADAQLVYLERQGLIEGIISEDSDMLVFGAKRLLTKLDQFGDCMEINRSNFGACTAISMTDWSDEEFRRMAILSGCDYLASVSGMGLKNAYRMVRKYKAIEKIVRMLQFDGKFQVGPGYLEAFRKADLTFQYQRVFCPTQKKVVTLTELRDHLELGDLDFVGPPIDSQIAAGVAMGDLDPMTKAPIARLKQGQYTATPQPRSMPDKEQGVPLTAVKGNQSIDNFFRSTKRNPLAELDPNSFTPSPSQQQILRQAAGSVWESPTVSVETPTRNVSNSTNTDTTQSSGIHRQNITPNAMSIPRPKRRRLLDDEDPTLSSPTNSLQNKRSPFFNKGEHTTNPKRRSSTSSKSAKAKGFEVWCDNSTGATRPEIIEEVGTQFSLGCKQARSPVQSTKSAGMPTTQRDTPVSTPGFDGSSDLSSAITDRNISAISLSPTRQVTSQAPLVNKATKNAIEAADEGDVQVEKEAYDRRQRSTTPLQRIGAGALNRSLSHTRPLHYTARMRLGGSISSTSTSAPVTPCLPMNRSIGPDASRLKGSEDFIIPDSDEELDDVMINDRRERGANIDLGRFVFNG